MTAGGLQGAPATKLWIYSVLIFSLVFAWSPAWRHALMRLRFVPHITRDWQIWRLASIQLGVATTTELTSTLVIVYRMRSVERILGTRKFAAFVFVAGVVGLTLSVVLLAGARWMLPARIYGAVNMVAGGPLVTVFACLAQYYMLVPSKRVRALGVTVGDKWLTYGLAANLLGESAAVPALAGIMAGAVYAADVAGLKQWRFPQCVEHAAVRLMSLVTSRQARVQRPANRAHQELIGRLQGMFPAAGHEQIAQALRLAAGDADRAVSILLSGSQ
ncbi:hypothetical protein IW137_000665 [Coemansia sp. RSA 1287]|nr:hypothetical protein IW137_000665 [Coemansia sp. RSA 1287]